MARQIFRPRPLSSELAHTVAEMMMLGGGGRGGDRLNPNLPELEDDFIGNFISTPRDVFGRKCFKPKLLTWIFLVFPLFPQILFQILLSSFEAGCSHDNGEYPGSNFPP